MCILAHIRVIQRGELADTDVGHRAMLQSRWVSASIILVVFLVLGRLHEILSFIEVYGSARREFPFYVGSGGRNLLHKDKLSRIEECPNNILGRFLRIRPGKLSVQDFPLLLAREAIEHRHKYGICFLLQRNRGRDILHDHSLLRCNLVKNRTVQERQHLGDRCFVLRGIDDLAF